MPTTRLTSTVESLGSDIVSGRMPAGTSATMSELEERHSVSKSVMREAVRSLQAMGLVKSTQRVGVTVLSRIEWNHFAPSVIRWKLASEANADHLRELTELRSAIEPTAARLAALRGSAGNGVRLLELAAEIRTAVLTQDRERMIAADVEFHDLILRASGNDMFIQLQIPISATVEGRSELGLLPQLPDEASLRAHQAIAEAIHGGDAPGAQRLVLELVGSVIEETDPEGSSR